MASPWNSLQVATLGVQALTPLVVAGVGYFVARTSRRIEEVQWANQTVVTRRLEIFAQVAPWLNQLFCFATFVGGWKETQPAHATNLKRKLDETMYANRVLFSDALFDAYREFTEALFDMYASVDADAPLRVPISCHLGDRRNMTWWAPVMEALFTTTNTVSREHVQATYYKLEERFRADLYVDHEGHQSAGRAAPTGTANTPRRTPILGVGYGSRGGCAWTPRSVACLPAWKERRAAGPSSVWPRQAWPPGWRPARRRSSGPPRRTRGIRPR